MSDIRRMQLGQVVDFVITYNERMQRTEDSKEKQAQPRRRQATQADINAFFG